MRNIFVLVGKDFANLRRNRTAFIVSLVVPVMIIWIVGPIFGLSGSRSGPSGIPLAVVNQSGDPAAQTLVDALKAEPSFGVITTREGPNHSTVPLTEADLEPMIRDRKFAYALVIPPDLVSTERLGLHLTILSDPRNNIESQMVNGLLEKTIFSNVPQLLGRSLQTRAKAFLGSDRLTGFDRSIAEDVAGTFGGDAEAIRRRIESGDFGLDRLTAHNGGTGGGTEDGDVFSRIVRVDRRQVVGKDVKSPQATQVVAGYAVMFLLFALSNSSAAFFEEKNTGVFQRILAGPVSRGQLLGSRFVYGILFGLMQLMALFLAGRILYGVDFFGRLPGLAFMCVCVAAACTGFGMLLATITKSAQAAAGLATLLVITMSACGGAWFPVSFMPPFMQHVARFTLVYWSIEGFNEVLWARGSFAELLPFWGILLGFAAAAMIVATWRFNRSAIFE
ncbi:MAG TPA: ABC transporter permease [Candidatus Didemnitutus sp.]